MKKLLTVVLVLGVVFTAALSGCGEQKAASSSAAIENSKTMATLEQKVNYLMGQAKTFYNSKDFQQALDVAQYVLSSVDKDSQAAKSLVEKIKQEMTAKAQAAVEDVKKSLGGLGK